MRKKAMKQSTLNRILSTIAIVLAILLIAVVYLLGWHLKQNKLYKVQGWSSKT
ncbi:hypothetical protein SDC9_118419 [bioreactor metagenome]|uniref:Uncharacterized protein n=1 Tax=bioreactor metagenome TaxID=1076179 RepID=A0A645C8X1_9ZZZZ